MCRVGPSTRVWTGMWHRWQPGTLRTGTLVRELGFSDTKMGSADKRVGREVMEGAICRG